MYTFRPNGKASGINLSHHGLHGYDCWNIVVAFLLERWFVIPWSETKCRVRTWLHIICICHLTVTFFTSCILSNLRLSHCSGHWITVNLIMYVYCIFYFSSDWSIYPVGRDLLCIKCFIKVLNKRVQSSCRVWGDSCTLILIVKKASRLNLVMIFIFLLSVWLIVLFYNHLFFILNGSIIHAFLLLNFYLLWFLRLYLLKINFVMALSVSAYNSLQLVNICRYLRLGFLEHRNRVVVPALLMNDITLMLLISKR